MNPVSSNFELLFLNSIVHSFLAFLFVHTVYNTTFVAIRLRASKTLWLKNSSSLIADIRSCSTEN